MFEMLVGFPPFYSEEPLATCRKVCINWLKYPASTLLPSLFMRIFMSPDDLPQN